MPARAAILVPALAASVLSTMVWRAPNSDAAIDTAVHKAATYATSRGLRTGIAVMNIRTGAVWTGGSANAEFPTESVVKVFIATRILLQGRMHGATAARAYKMVTQSDDAIASSLYPTVGGAGIEPWIERHYGVKNLGSAPSTYPRNWGNTKITAAGMVHFYAKAIKDRRVGPWLLNAMHHAHHYASDGFDQFFGLKIADPAAAVKQGWGGDDNRFNSTVMPSTGYVDHDRYAVALLTMTVPQSTYHRVRVVSNAQARILLPGGHIDDPFNHRPVLGLQPRPTKLEGVHVLGNVVHIIGWAWDVDGRSSQLRVRAVEGATIRATVRTTIARADVNRHYHITGRHGYNLAFTAANGRHTYCVSALSVGIGPNRTRCAASVVVNGNPRGYFDSARIVHAKPVLTGWVDDRDMPGTSSSVQVMEGTRSVGVWVAAVARPDVNRRLHITGRHGFVITLTGVRPGRHSYRAFALNRGSHYGAARVLLGTKTVTVPR